MATVAEATIGFTIKGVGDVTRQFRDALKVDPKSMRDFDSRMSKATKNFEKMLKEAPEDMFGSKAMTKATKLHASLEKSQLRVTEVIGKLSKKNLQEEEKVRLEEQLKRERQRHKTQAKLLSKEQSNLTRWGRRRAGMAKSVNDLVDKGSKKNVNDLSQGIENAFSKLRGAGFQDIVGMIGAGIGKAGDATRKGGKATAGAAGGAGNKRLAAAMKGLGAGMKVMGASLAAIGALTGAVALLVKLFMGLDKEIKEVNKSFLDGAGAADLMTSRTASFTEELEAIRDAAFDVGNNLKWMTTGREQMDILKAFNEGGLLLRNMTKNIGDARDRMKEYQDVTSVALTYSRLLGIESTKMAQDMGTLMAETGVNLNEVRDGFSKVAEIAKTSGFNTKRFYTTILEATSGTHFYNVRIEEAAILLSRFTDMLGKRPGTEFFKSMQEGFADMSYKERIKQIMVSGAKATKRIIAAEAEKAADKFGTTFAKNTDLHEAFQNAGLTFTTPKSAGREIAEKLGKMNEKEYAKTLIELQASNKVSPEIRNELENIRELTKGSKGSLGDMAKAMDNMSATGTMAMKLTSIVAKNIHNSSAIQRIAFEEIKGISGKQLEELIRASRYLSGAFTQLQKNEKFQAKSLGVAEGATIALKDSDVSNKESIQSMVDKYGAIADEEGRVFRAIADGKGNIEVKERLESLQEFMVKQNSLTDLATEITKEEMTKDQMLAQEIIQNTEPIDKTLNIIKDGVMMDIYQSVRPLGDLLTDIAVRLVSMFGGGDDAAKEIREQREAQKQNTETMQRLRDEITTYSSAITKLGEKKKIAKGVLGSETASEEEKRLARQNLEKYEQDIGAAKGGQRVRGEQITALSSLEPKTLDDISNALNTTRQVAQKDIIEGGGSVGGVSGFKEFLKFEKKAEKQKKKDDQAKALLEKGNVDAFLDLGKNVGTNTVTAINETPDKTAKANAREERKREDLKEAQKLMTALGFSAGSFQAKKVQEQIEAESYGRARRSLKSHAANPKSKSSQGFMGNLGLGFGGQSAVDKGLQHFGITKTNDFILTKTGRLIEPNANDTIIGFKPGGPLAGAGGAKDINITIVESHNIEKTYAVVKRVLRDGGVI